MTSNGAKTYRHYPAAPRSSRTHRILIGGLGLAGERVHAPLQRLRASGLGEPLGMALLALGAQRTLEYSDALLQMQANR
jgi:hypothetical protein